MPQASGPAAAQGSASFVAGKPTLVLIYDRTCPVCEKVIPVINNIEQDYKSKANFVRFEVTDDAAKSRSRKAAKELKLTIFLRSNEDAFPVVGVFSCGRKCLNQYKGLVEKTTVTRALDDAMKIN